jgi:hypothetical protein
MLLFYHRFIIVPVISRPWGKHGCLEGIRMMWRVGLLQVWIWCCRACLVFCSEGGYFNAIMSFPPNYPNSPPSVRFTSDMWHPNGEYSQTGRYCFEDNFFSFFLFFLPYNLSLKVILFVCKGCEEMSSYPWLFACLQYTLMDVFASPFFMHLEMIQMVMSLLVSDGRQCIR